MEKQIVVYSFLEYSIAMKINKLAMYIKLTNIVLSERDKLKNDKYSMMPHI